MEKFKEILKKIKNWYLGQIFFVQMLLPVFILAGLTIIFPGLVKVLIGAIILMIIIYLIRVFAKK